MTTKDELQSDLDELTQKIGQLREAWDNLDSAVDTFNQKLEDAWLELTDKVDDYNSAKDDLRYLLEDLESDTGDGMFDYYIDEADIDQPEDAEMIDEDDINHLENDLADLNANDFDLEEDEEEDEEDEEDG